MHVPVGMCTFEIFLKTTWNPITKWFTRYNNLNGSMTFREISISSHEDEMTGTWRYWFFLVIKQIFPLPIGYIYIGRKYIYFITRKINKVRCMWTHFHLYYLHYIHARVRICRMLNILYVVWWKRLPPLCLSRSCMKTPDRDWTQ